MSGLENGRGNRPDIGRDDLWQARSAVVRVCRQLVERGLVVGTAGNVSARSGDLMAVSPSGVDYDKLTPEHVGVHDLRGRAVDAPLQPTSELALHVAAHASPAGEAAGDSCTVVHTHAVASTALSTVVDGSGVGASHYYCAMFGGAVPVTPYATFGSQQLADSVAAALTDRSAVLLGNHGAVVVAGSPDRGLEAAGYLEYLCEVELRALATGLPVRRLPPDEIERVGELLGGYGQEISDR